MNKEHEQEMIGIMYSIMKSLNRIANSLDKQEGESNE
jgi:hypothetical protein